MTVEFGLLMLGLELAVLVAVGLVGVQILRTAAAATHDRRTHRRDAGHLLDGRGRAQAPHQPDREIHLGGGVVSRMVARSSGNAERLSFG